MKRKSKILSICSSITFILMICIIYMLMQWVESIYNEESALKYLHLAKLLGYGNVLPILFALAYIVRYSVLSKVPSVNETINLLTTLEKILYVQAAYTFISVNIIAFLENVGPFPIFILEFMVIFLSLTLATMFNVIAEIVQSKIQSKVKSDV